MRQILLHTQEGHNIITIYRVEIKYDESGVINKKSCTCPAFDKYWGDCKHITAVLLKARDLFGHSDGVVEDRYTGAPAAETKTPLEKLAEENIKAGCTAASGSSLTKTDPNILISGENFLGKLSLQDIRGLFEV